VVQGHHLVGVKKKQAEQRPLFDPREPDRLVIQTHFERPEYVEAC
jgi:hypothetical protein